MRELEFLQHIVRETAKMSYPGRFSGTLLRDNAKEVVMQHFVNRFPGRLRQRVRNYERWHSNRVHELANVLIPYRRNRNDSTFAISAKLVNTFIHQFMKYDRFRYLYKNIHLPLDSKVFGRLLSRGYNHNELQNLRNLVRPFRNCAYQFGRETYVQIQQELWGVVSYFNANVLTNNCQIYSRIDLNCLLWR